MRPTDAVPAALPPPPKPPRRLLPSLLPSAASAMDAGEAGVAGGVASAPASLSSSSICASHTQLTFLAPSQLALSLVCSNARLADGEVSEAHAAVRAAQHVLRLHIAVADALPVAVRQRGRHVRQRARRVRAAQRRRAAPAERYARQQADTLQKLHSLLRMSAPVCEDGAAF